MAAARKFRMDPRLIIGIVLVLASVVGVIGVVRTAAETTTVYVATTTLAKGDRITADQVSAVEVSAATPTNLYLTSVSDLDFVATRPIGEGEFIPKTALGEADTTESAVVVTIAGELPAAIGAGTDVEVWAAEPAERMGTYEAPSIIVAQAHVVRIVENDDFVSQREVEVELRIPDSGFANLMNVTSNGARLQLVPLHEPVGQ